MLEGLSLHFTSVDEVLNGRVCVFNIEPGVEKTFGIGVVEIDVVTVCFCCCCEEVVLKEQVGQRL